MLCTKKVWKNKKKKHQIFNVLLCLGGAELGASTYRLVLVDRILDAAGVLRHPWGVEYGDAGHAQYWRWKGEVNAGRGDLW